MRGGGTDTGAPAHCSVYTTPSLQHQVLISWDLEFEDLNGRIVTLLQGLILTPTGQAGCRTVRLLRGVRISQ